MKPLKCPYCDNSVRVMMGWEGAGYAGCQVVDGFECTNTVTCGADWDVNGNVSGESFLVQTVAS